MSTTNHMIMQQADANWPGIHVWGPGLYQVGESDRQIPQGNDCVGSYCGVRRFLQNSEQQLKVTLTKLWAGK